MHRRNGGFIIFILQISKKQTKLFYQKHSLIYNRPAGQRNHINVIVGLFKHPSGYIQLPVKGQPLFHILRPLHKSLHNIRHTIHGFLAQLFRRNGHFPPAQKFHAFLFHNDFKHLFSLIPLQLILGKEKHADSVIPFFSHLNSRLFCRLFEEFMGNLQKNSYAVSRFPFRILSCPVFQILYNLQCIFYGLVGLDSLNIHHCADSAVVMFKAWVIHAHGCSFRFLHVLILPAKLQPPVFDMSNVWLHGYFVVLKC